MRGLPAFNFPAFLIVADYLRTAGWDVFNPADKDIAREMEESGLGWEEAYEKLTTNDEEPPLTLAEYMADDLPQVCLADAVVVMPGWEESVGAGIETKVAHMLNKPVYSYPSGRRIHPDDEALVCDDGTEALLKILAEDDDELTEMEDEEAREFMAELAQPTVALSDTTTGWRLYNEAIARGQKLLRPPSEAPSEVEVGIEEDGGQVIIADPASGGRKGRNLLRYGLIPFEMLRALARHYGVGAVKYDDNNWRQGYAWSLSLDALIRHLEAWRGGESITVEAFEKDGVNYRFETHHLIAVIWQATTLYCFERWGIGRDDVRP